MKNENALAIAAINEEARKRGLTYGQLMALTTPAERIEIIGKFSPAEAERRRNRAPTKFKESKRKK